MTAISFDGTDDYINCGTETGLWSQSLTKFSFSFLVYPTENNVSGVSTYLFNHGDTVAKGIRCYQQTGNDALVFNIKNAAGTNIVAAGPINPPINKSYHVACVYDNSLGSANLKIYINGVVGTTTGNLTEAMNLSAITYLGGGTSGTNAWKGLIRDFRWWTTKALTQTEVNNVRDSDPSAPAPDYWLKIDEGSSNPVDNISGTKTGTLTNGASWVTSASSISISKYDILKLASSSIIGKYDIMKLALSSIISKYDISQLSLSSIIGKYDIRQLISSTVISLYDIRKTAGSTIISKYDIRQLALSVIISVYDILIKTSSTIVSKYDIRQLAFSSIASKYDIRQLASSVIISLYDILRPVSSVIISKYDIHKLAFSSINSVYDIRQLAISQIISKYGIRQLASSIITSVYDITLLNFASSVVTSVYNIRQHAGSTITAKYNILYHRISRKIGFHIREGIPRAGSFLRGLYDRSGSP